MGKFTCSDQMQKASSSQGLIHTIPSRYSSSSGAIARYSIVIIFGNSQIKYVDGRLMGFGTISIETSYSLHIQTQYLYLYQYLSCFKEVRAWMMLFRENDLK